MKAIPKLLTGEARVCDRILFLQVPDPENQRFIVKILGHPCFLLPGEPLAAPQVSIRSLNWSRSRFPLGVARTYRNMRQKPYVLLFPHSLWHRSQLSAKSLARDPVSMEPSRSV